VRDGGILSEISLSRFGRGSLPCSAAGDWGSNAGALQLGRQCPRACNRCGGGVLEWLRGIERVSIIAQDAIAESGAD
jgi:hypothetical protein